MKYSRLFLGCAAVLALFVIFSQPCHAYDISKDYWFITEDNGTGIVRLYSPFRAHITFKDGHGNTVSELTLNPGELRVSKLIDLGYPQGELFCINIVSDRYISCWLKQYFTKTRSQVIYPAQFNTYVYSSAAISKGSDNDYFWIYSGTTQQINFLGSNLNLLFSPTVLAEEIISVDVSEELGILETPYAVTITGQESFVAVFHDSPNFVGSIQTFNR
jgi:hypothetical protein